MSSLILCVDTAVTNCDEPFAVAHQLLKLLEDPDSDIQGEREKIDQYIDLPRWIESPDPPADRSEAEPSDVLSDPGERVQQEVDRYVKRGLEAPEVFLRSLRPLAVADAYQWLCENPDAVWPSDPIRRQEIDERLEGDSIGFWKMEITLAKQDKALDEVYFKWRQGKTECECKEELVRLHPSQRSTSTKR